MAFIQSSCPDCNSTRTVIEIRSQMAPIAVAKCHDCGAKFILQDEPNASFPSRPSSAQPSASQVPPQIGVERRQPGGLSLAPYNQDGQDRRR